MSHHWFVRTAVAALILASAAGAGAQTAHPSFSVTVTGKGPAMLLIPGLLSSGEVWDSTVARYQDRYTLHVLTLAGFGGPAPVGEPFLSRVRDEVIGYLRERQLKQTIIVGHSLGGFLGFWITATAPDLVGGLVAVDGVPFLPALGNPAATADSARAQAGQIKAIYASLSNAQLVAQTRMALGTMITAPADVELALSWAARSDAATAGTAVAELMSTDLRPVIDGMTAPTLLLGATAAAPEAMRAAMAKSYEAQVSRAGQARVIMADKARHFIMLDDPAFFFAALDQFLAARQSRER
ncbi:MAG: alpha/beta fold hydrolase [Vicinamibacterales bacterium]